MSAEPSSTPVRRVRAPAQGTLQLPRLPAAAGGHGDDHAHAGDRAAHALLVQLAAVAGRDHPRRGDRALSAARYANTPPGTSREPDFAFPREYRGVYLERRRECGFQLYESVGIARGDREAAARQTMENYRLFGAPHAMIVTTDEALGVYGVLDCGAWVNNFMLAARSLGVASIAQAALGAHPKFLRSYFGLPADRLVVCGMSFGYEDAAHPVNRFRTSRAAVDSVVSWVDQ